MTVQSAAKRVLRNSLPYPAIRGLRKLYFYSAAGFYCPICETPVRKRTFSGTTIPIVEEAEVIGSQFKPNDVCPVCFASERHRLTFLYLERETPLITPPSAGARYRVLHIAPEHGMAYRLARAPHVDYVPGDLDPSRYFYVKTVRLDLMGLPFADASFDYVLCSHVLEHVPDDGQAMRELLRVLKPGGAAVLQVPLALKREVTDEDPTVTSEADRLIRFAHEDHVRLYGRDFADRLAAQGFTVERYDAHAREPELARRYDVNPKETLYIARRPAA